jgi:hypothetical protein
LRRHIQFYASQTKNGNDFSSGRRVSFLNLRLSTYCRTFQMTVCVGLRERNQYCTSKSRTPSTTVPDDRGTSGTKYSKSPLVVLHCSTSFGVHYCQKMHANIKTHHLSAWQFNGKRHKILPNIIMTAANVCSSCTILDAIAWRRGRS